MPKSAREQLNALLRGAVTVSTREELLRKLERSAETGKPLRVKLGLDPTHPDIHLGHTVVLGKLRRFQDLGHQAVVIIGDFTALVGDPTGRNVMRPPLTPQEIESSARTYFDQVGRVLDLPKLEIVRNSAWLKGLSFFELLKLTGRFTVAQFLEREDFHRRYAAGKPLGLHEMLYPVMQAYDSVMVKADVELGGTDQTFNLLAGRDLMRAEGLEPQVVMTMPLLRGLDGEHKMSKSLENHIGVSWPARETYFGVMRIPDAIMKEWYTLVTGLPLDEIDRLCDAGKTHPKEAKVRLAKAIVGRFHGEKEADAAAAQWDQEVSKGQLPEKIPDLAVAAKIGAVQLVVATKKVKSNGEARRLIEQGGVELDGEKMADPKRELALKGGEILKVGRKDGFFRIVLK